MPRAVTARRHEPTPPATARKGASKETGARTSRSKGRNCDDSDTALSSISKGNEAIENYILGKTLGQGTFGKVRKGVHKLTGLPVAIKVLEKDKIVDMADVERVRREIKILNTVNHPNVIRLYEVIDSPKRIYLIMEYVAGGELFNHIVAKGRVKEKQAVKFFHCIVNGMAYFHEHGIIHRDLKPENLLLDDLAGIKIVDFGLGNFAPEGTLLKTACGSPCYAAPEMVAGKRYLGPGVDMWSLGVVLFALVCGYLPFEDPKTNVLYEKIINCDYEIPDFVSAAAADLISKLLCTEPRLRYTVDQVQHTCSYTSEKTVLFQIRKHPWYASASVLTDPAVLQSAQVSNLAYHTFPLSLSACRMTRCSRLSAIGTLVATPPSTKIFSM